MELLIPTLSKIISYQFLLIFLEGKNHEQSCQNNQSTWCSPCKVWVEFFSKLIKSFHGRTNIFGQKIYVEVILNVRTDDQIMPRWGKSGEEFRK